MKKRSLFGPIKFLFSISIGLIYGLLFAQKSGKSLRAELKRSKNPTMTFLKELWDVDKAALDKAIDLANKSETLQEVIGKGTDQFDAFVGQAKVLGEDAMERAKEELELLADHAQVAADELKDAGIGFSQTAKSKVSDAKKEATKQMKKVKKEVTKKAKVVKKDAEKKVTKAKKAVQKKVTAAKKASAKKAKEVKKKV